MRRLRHESMQSSEQMDGCRISGVQFAWPPETNILMLWYIVGWCMRKCWPDSPIRPHAPPGLRGRIYWGGISHPTQRLIDDPRAQVEDAFLRGGPVGASTS